MLNKENAKSAARDPIVYDITRIIIRVAGSTPNGMDRVDFSYAAHFLRRSAGQTLAAAFAGPMGFRLLDRSNAAGAVDTVNWQLQEQTNDLDRDLIDLILNWITGSGSKPEKKRKSRLKVAATWLQVPKLVATRFGSLGQSMPNAMPRNSRFLCISQFPLPYDFAFNWTRSRPDVKLIFFVHDLLPLDYPEYFRPAEQQRHARRMANLTRFGDAALVSTLVVRERLLEELERRGRKNFPVIVAPMPLSPLFFDKSIPALVAAHPFFVLCSTIEPRKNHLTVLHAWRALAAEMGHKTPKLILVGARGWENEMVVDLLERSPSIQKHVLELNGLNTPTLVSLLRGAAGLLMPSFAEGFGLPVAEACALGVPIIASDIPVFHEVSNGQMTAVDPLNSRAWCEAIKMHCSKSPRSQQPVDAVKNANFVNINNLMDGL